ncbi:DUF2207 family protein, partial [Pseudomonadota bacterium]
TGEGWQIPINRTTAIINSPHATITKIECFSGEFGLNNSLCQTKILSNHQAQVTYNKAINYGDNLTVAIALDQTNSQIVFPSGFAKMIKLITDNILVLVVLFPVTVMFFLWYRKGRDLTFISQNIFDNNTQKPTKLKPIFEHNRTPMVYQPLTHLTPGEAGTILDERVDNQDVIAEIIDLARKEYLKIEPAKKTGIIFKSEDFLFTKLRKSDDLLPKHQKYLLGKIFKSGDKVKLSALKGKFYTALNKTKQLIYKSVTAKKLFTTNPNKVRGAYIGLGVLMLGFAFFLAIRALEQGSFIPFVLTIIQTPFVFILAFLMVQKSAIGTNYHLQAKGLKHTINVGAWRQKVHEKNLFIQDVLPFAISLGVINKLTRDMKDLDVSPPSYLAGSTAAAHGFNTGAFINNFATQAGNNLSYNPSSSSAGGSGFSGGFSGGGGGGGGGGSW